MQRRELAAQQFTPRGLVQAQDRLERFRSLQCAQEQSCHFCKSRTLPELAELHR